MPEYTPNHSIAYPAPSDWIKTQNVASKLAEDLRQTALTADAAITHNANQTETWLDRVSYARRTFPHTDLNDGRQAGVYSLGNYPDGYLNTPEGNDWPSILDVKFPNHITQWGVQELYQYGANPRRWWRIARTFTTWNDWIEIEPYEEAATAGADYITTPPPAAGANSLRLQRFKDEYPLVSTQGKGVVVFRYDHGLNNFKDVLLPLHQQYGIKAYIAMNSRRWHIAESNAVTHAEAQQWRTAGLVEWGSHTTDHGDKVTAPEIWEAIVAGRQELEEQVGGEIHGFTVPGVGGTRLQGFGGGTIDSFTNTYAGGVILASHAISSGSIAQPAGSYYRTLDGVIRQGGRHAGWDSTPWEDIKSYIDHAATNQVALTLMCHPSVMGGTSGEQPNWTPELAEQIISYVRQLIDDGQLANISYYQSHHATTGAI